MRIVNEYIDIDDLPRVGWFRGLNEEIRRIPEGKALLIPCLPGETPSHRQAIISANRREVTKSRPGQTLRTKQDTNKNGVWVWWTTN